MARSLATNHGLIEYDCSKGNSEAPYYTVAGLLIGKRKSIHCPITFNRGLSEKLSSWPSELLRTRLLRSQLPLSITCLGPNNKTAS